MVEHIVLFKFETSTTKKQKDDVILRLKTLKEEIPGIIDIQAGHNFSNKNQGFEVGLTVRFKDRKALEEYGPHPKHQEVIAYLKEVRLSEIIILDFEI